MEQADHQLGCRIHRAPRHAARTHVVRRLKRHLEREVLAAPDLQFADGLPLVTGAGTGPV